MNRHQLEKLYEVNGLKDYKLKHPTDLIRTHGIDYIAVDGFNRLDEANKLLYAEFIINFFNGLGMDSRATLVPKGIYYVEDVDFSVKADPDDDYHTISGGRVMAIDRNGLKTVHRAWSDPDYAHLEQTEGKPKTYLRIEYEHQGRDEWLHVIDPTTWY